MEACSYCTALSPQELPVPQAYRRDKNGFVVGFYEWPLDNDPHNIVRIEVHDNIIWWTCLDCWHRYPRWRQEMRQVIPRQPSTESCTYCTSLGLDGTDDLRAVEVHDQVIWFTCSWCWRWGPEWRQERRTDLA